MSLRTLISQKVNSEIFRGIKPKLIAVYEKFYDYRRTVQMHVLSHKDDAYAKAHPLRIMQLDKTLEYILEKRCSVARYGDGEFNLLSNSGIGFQNNDPHLVARLREIVKADSDTCLVCIPGIFTYEQDYDRSTRKFWKKILVHKRADWYGYCNQDYHYGNADITRCYLEFADRTRAENCFRLMKKLWDGRDLVIVEGALTRLGIGNDLFANASSIQRVLCPVTNAFASYEQIKNYVTEHVSREKLVLIALGPAATVLAYDLAECGYWAIDIGNVDKEYEWWLAKATCKQRNPIKFTMEVKGGTIVEDCLDQKYLSEIIYKI